MEVPWSQLAPFLPVRETPDPRQKRLDTPRVFLIFLIHMRLVIPEKILEKLRRSADRNLRSVGKEILFILQTWSDGAPEIAGGRDPAIRKNIPIGVPGGRPPGRPGRTGIRGVKRIPSGRYVATHRGTYLGVFPTVETAAEAVRHASENQGGEDGADAREVELSEIPRPSAGETEDAYRTRLRAAGVSDRVIADVLAAVAVPVTPPFAARSSRAPESPAEWDGSD